MVNASLSCCFSGVRLRFKPIFLTLLLVFSGLFFSSIIQAQTNNVAPQQLLTDNELRSLPLDTVLVKINDATSNMNGEHDAQIKQALWIVLARAKATNDPLYMAKAYQQLGSWHYRSINSENNDSIYHYDNQALTMLLLTNDKERISRAYRTVGMDLDDMQKYAEAEIAYFKGLKVAQSIGFQSGINSIHSSLSILYSNTKDFESALKYSKIVVEAYEKDKNYHPLIRALLNLNNIYLQLEQPQKSLEAINKAYSLISKLPQETQIAETLNVRSWRAKIYQSLKRYDEALEDYMFSWKGVQQKYGAEKANGWKGGIGGIYHLQGKHAQAIPYLRDYIHHFKGKKVNNPEELTQHNIWMAESWKALGQADSAYIYMASGKDIAINSLQEEAKSLRNELRVKYETEQKDQTIASQSGQIQQQNKIQTLSFVIGGLLILLLGGLFFTYRNNMKRNLQLQTLNKNLEITNAQLDKRNAENELLLKEIHHRVKNNLEVVSSLLALQSAKIEDPDLQDAMLASQNRVQSMGILHQKLYQSEHLAFIEMKNYFQNLCENILDSYNETERIAVNIDMKELQLDVDTAVPVGLSVNELLTNSLKYAFPEGKKGEIKL
ncbi:MAG: hypothetical protein MUE30_07275, partial [Spirosomaceae bacterium]|nr:hypothetical protein [Spirosomataceae bacterium]